MPKRALREVMRALPGDEAPSEFLVFWPGINDATDGVPALFDDQAAERVVGQYRKLARGINLTFGHTWDSAGEVGLTVRRGPVEVIVGLDEHNEPIKETRDGPSLWAVNTKWTERAAEGVVSKAWRYISAVFTYDRIGRIAELLQIGLTNDPATLGAQPLMQLAREYQSQREHGESLYAALEKLGKDFWPDASQVYVSDILMTDAVVYNAIWYADDGAPGRDVYFRAPFAVALDGTVTLTAPPVEVERSVEYRPIVSEVAAEAPASRSIAMDMSKVQAAIEAVYPGAVIKLPMSALILTAEGANLVVGYEMAEDGSVMLSEPLEVSTGGSEAVAQLQEQFAARERTLSEQHATAVQALEQRISAREQAAKDLEPQLREGLTQLALHRGTITVAELKAGLYATKPIPDMVKLANAVPRMATHREIPAGGSVGGTSKSVIEMSANELTELKARDPQAFREVLRQRRSQSTTAVWSREQSRVF